MPNSQPGDFKVESGAIVGRGVELSRFSDIVAKVQGGAGTLVLVSGEAGIGKTRFVQECKALAMERGFTVKTEQAVSGSLEPFHLFSYLYTMEAVPWARGVALATFEAVLLMDRAGKVLHQSSKWQGMGAEAIAGVISVVQRFARDSFGQGDKGALDRMDYGEFKIILEYGKSLVLAAVMKGGESDEAAGAIKDVLDVVERARGEDAGAFMPESAAKALDELAKRSYATKAEQTQAMVDGERLRIADAILDKLAAEADKGQTVVQLEDLHWADDSSLFVFAHLARNLKGRRLLLLATARPGESPQLDSKVKKMADDGEVVVIDLQPLSKEDVKGIFDAAFPGNDISAEFTSSVAAKCGGNPFFITELMRQMKSEGLISESGGRYVLKDGGASLPSSVDDFVGQKLARLEPEVMGILEFASCIGARFDKRLLEANEAITDVGLAAARMYETGIVHSADGTAAFSHAIFQEAVYRGIAQRWKSSHHKALGERYEVLYSERLDEVMYELARHFSRSSEHRKAYEYCSRAGAKAESEYAPAQALELYGQARQALENIKEDTGTRTKLIEKTGDLRALLGQFQDAEADFDAADALYTVPDDKARTVRKKCSVMFSKGEYRAALAKLADARGHLANAGLEYVRIRVLETDVLVHMGELKNAKATMMDALRALESSKAAPRDTAEALKQMGTIKWRMGELEEALLYLRQSVEIAKKAGYDKGVAYALNNIGGVQMDQGRYDEAIESLSESMRLKHMVGDVATLAMSLGNIGNAHYRKGEFATALEFHRKAMAMKERYGQKWGIAASSMTMGVIQYAQGHLAEAMKSYERSRKIWTDIGSKAEVASVMNNIGEVHLMLGDVTAASDAYSNSLATASEASKKTSMISARCGLARACLAGGRLEDALAHAKIGCALAVEMNGKSDIGRCLSIMGQALMERGQNSEGESNFLESIKTLEQCNARGELAYSYYEYGRSLARIGRSGEARKYLAKSLEMFETMGMRLWAENARAALDGLR